MFQSDLLDREEESMKREIASLKAKKRKLIERKRAIIGKALERVLPDEELNRFLDQSVIAKSERRFLGLPEQQIEIIEENTEGNGEKTGMAGFIHRLKNLHLRTDG